MLAEAGAGILHELEPAEEVVAQALVVDQVLDQQSHSPWAR